MKEIVELVSMVGDKEPLYSALIGLIRRRFAETGEAHLCSLRLELVMAAHDVNVETVVKLDPCHSLAWCLDGCVRDKHIDSQQTARLKNILDGWKKASADLLGDMAIIAADSHVVHFLASMVVKVLRENAASCGGHLPRDMHSLQLLIRVLALGASAQALVRGSSSPSLVDSIFFTKFLPALSGLLVEDAIRVEIQRTTGDAVSEETFRFLSEPSDAVLAFLRTDRLAAVLWLHAALDQMPGGKRRVDPRGLVRYLRPLPRLKDKVPH